MTKWDLFQGHKIGSTYKNQSKLHTTLIEWRQKSHMIRTIDIEKAFDKIQHPFMTIIFRKLGTEGNFLNMIKVLYEKPTANIIFNAERQSFSCKIRNKTKMLSFASSIQHSIGCSSQMIWARKRNKRHPSWKGRSKIISVHRWYNLICRKPWLCQKNQKTKKQTKTDRANKHIQQSCRI